MSLNSPLKAVCNLEFELFAELLDVTVLLLQFDLHVLGVGHLLPHGLRTQHHRLHTLWTKPYTSTVRRKQRPCIRKIMHSYTSPKSGFPYT